MLYNNMLVGAEFVIVENMRLNVAKRIKTLWTMWVMLKVEERRIMVIHTTQAGGITLTSHGVEIKTKTKISHKGPTNIEHKEISLSIKIMVKVIIKVHNKGVWLMKSCSKSW